MNEIDNFVISSANIKMRKFMNINPLTLTFLDRYIHKPVGTYLVTH